MPQRIQRKRSKGWRMPEGAVYVGRPTKWGNPWNLSRNGFAAERRVIVDWYRKLASETLSESIRAELRGRDLACWCALDQPCHADVLLEIANS